MAQAEQPTMYRSLTDDAGNEAMRIFSTTGDPRTKAEFDSALRDAKAGKPTPGFTILDKGSFQEVARSGFEKTLAPARTILPAAGREVGRFAATSPLAILLTKLGVAPEGNIGGALTKAGAGMGEALGQGVVEQVKTPGRALGTAAGMAASALGTNPTSRIPTGGMANAGADMLKGAMLGNMLKVGGATALGNVAGEFSTGGDIAPGPIAINAGLAALGEGAKGVINHFVTNYFRPDMGEKVAADILGVLKDRYSNLSNDPNLINMAAKTSPEQIRQITQIGSRALMGNLDDFSADLTAGVRGVFNVHAPRAMSVGEQATLRAEAKSIAEAGRKLLENVNDPTARTEAKAAMQEAAQKIQTLLADTVAKTKMKNDPTPLYDQARVVIQRSMDSIKHYEEGAKVISAFEQAGARNGFDPVKFNDIIAGRYMEEPGSLLERVGERLGMGQTLRPSSTEAPPELGNTVLNWAKNQLVPPILTKMFRVPKAPAPTFQWQVPEGLNTFPANVVPELPGATIKGFLSHDKK